MESPPAIENIFAVCAEKPGLRDDLGGLGERRERAWDERCQGEHQATEADQHGLAPRIARLGDELRLELSHLGRSDRRYTAVQVGGPIIELRAFPWTGGAA